MLVHPDLFRLVEFVPEDRKSEREQRRGVREGRKGKLGLGLRALRRSPSVHDLDGFADDQAVRCEVGGRLVLISPLEHLRHQGAPLVLAAEVPTFVALPE